MQSQDQTLAAVLVRLETLERQNRMLKRAGLAALLVSGCVLLMAQATAKRVIEADEFVLRGRAGKVAGTLSTNAAGHGQLLLYDPDGNERIAARVSAGDSTVFLAGPHGGAWTSLGARDDTSYVVLKEPTKAGVELSANSEKVGLYLSDRSEKARAGISVAKDGYSGIALLDEHSRPMLALAAKETGPSLNFYDQNGKRRVLMASGAELGAALMFSDAMGTERVALMNSVSGASLIFMDANGKALWGAPQK